VLVTILQGRLAKVLLGSTSFADCRTLLIALAQGLLPATPKSHEIIRATGVKRMESKDAIKLFVQAYTADTCASCIPGLFSCLGPIRSMDHTLHAAQAAHPHA
jgi:hypothetical protein